MDNEVNNTPARPSAAASQQNNYGSILDILWLFIPKWYWFVISIVVCLGVAYFKVLTMQPQYSRSMTVLVKESGNRRSSNNLETVLGPGGFGGMSSKLVNEMETFKSPDLMTEVVRRLGLDVSYSRDGRFHDVVLYGNNLPVKVDFIQGENLRTNFIIQIDSAESVMIRDYSVPVPGGSNPLKQPDFRCRLGEPVSTPDATIIITRNISYSGPWAGEVKVSKTSVPAATGRYHSKVDAQADVKSSSDILKISCADASIARADDILATLLSVYNEKWAEDNNKRTYSTSMFIKERLATLEKDLGNVDSDISTFKSKNLMPDVSAASSMFLSQGQQLDQNIQALENQIFILNSLKISLSKNIGNDELIPMGSSIGIPEMSSRINEYNTAILRRNEMVSNSSESNPLVADMDAKLATIRSAMESSIEYQIATMKVQLAKLQGRSQQNESKIAASPAQSKYLLSVERQQKVKESLYLYLLQKQEENELTQAFTAYNTKIITKPFGSSAPVSPKTGKIMLIALLIGFCLPLAVIYIINIADTTIRSRADLGDIEIPIIGEIPYVPTAGPRKTFGLLAKRGKKKVTETVVVKQGRRDSVNESFRVIRTNLDFVDGGQKHVVYMFMSFLPGSGKSFISLNMSAVFGVKGHKVLLVDGDFRKITLSKYFGKPSVGFADYLAGKVDNVRDVIKTDSGIENVDVLPVGTIPPNPAELLSSEKFVSAIESLKQEYDYVFIDSVPVNIVADAMIVTPVADRTIFIVRSGLFEKSMVPEIVDIAEGGQVRSMMILLNAVDQSGHGYYSKGYSRYHYYYNYGHRYYGTTYKSYYGEEGKA